MSAMSNNDAMDTAMDTDDTPVGTASTATTLSARQIEQMTEDSMDTEDTKTSEQDTDVPNFPALSAEQAAGRSAYIRVGVPPHRFTPMHDHWEELYTPIVQHMKLDIRYNTKKKCVEIKTNPHTQSPAALQKAADFIKAFMMGFEIRDAIALLRLDDLFIDSFEIKDVKNLQGDHLSRAIGRIAGIGGKTKFAIENATKTRIVLAETHVHILGSYQNINIAKDAISRLIIGSPPGKVYTQMRAVSNRMKERF